MVTSPALARRSENSSPLDLTDMSPSFDPASGLCLVSAREVCQIYISEPPPTGYSAGDRVMGGRTRAGPERGWGALRAIDVVTGERKWELRHATPSWAGVTTTAGGVAFTGDAQGNVIAVNSRTGQELWRHQLGAPLYATPMTFMHNGRQYVVIGAGPTIAAFALR